ncbi:MAG: DUF1674 domain-containing protein [Rhodanobacteraceae bacterium]
MGEVMDVGGAMDGVEVAARVIVRCDNSDSRCFDDTSMAEESSDIPGQASTPAEAPATAPRERPTPEGDALDPTRYGDWEKNGRCIDF